jgi:hypothetical protein
VGLTQNYSDEDYASFVEYIVKMNGSVFNLDSHCRVIRVFPTKKKPDVFQAIVEIDGLAYETVMTCCGLPPLCGLRCFRGESMFQLQRFQPFFAKLL